MPGILEGIRLVEWAAWHNGPAAGYMLGDLGAEVIKIEEPVRGDPCRGVRRAFDLSMGLPGGRNVQFEAANRNKRSITLNLKAEAGRSIAYQLIERSDVFFHNYRPAVARRRGLDYATLRQVNPRLIYASNQAFGSRGPFRDWRAFDPTIQATSGAMYGFGDKDSPEPLMSTGALFDQNGATLLAYGILAALLARERFGLGQEVEVSLFGSALHLQCINVVATLMAGRSMPRHSRQRARSPLANYYRCADGTWLLCWESQSDRFWKDFCQAVGTPELADDPRFADVEARWQNCRELNPILEKVFACRSREEWLKAFQGYQFAYAPIYHLEEAVSHPQSLENDYIVELSHPTLGQTRTLGFPIKFSQTPARIQWPAPELGQHTEEVLLELGHSWEEVERLREQGVI